jgi:hypothetical protein
LNLSEKQDCYSPQLPFAAGFLLWDKNLNILKLGKTLEGLTIFYFSGEKAP